MIPHIPVDTVTALKMLAVDGVAKAKSGHPGMPVGMAEIAAVLWQKHLRHNPKNPQWFNRDRFVLSNGHGSMLLYALLHLSGYALSIDDLKNFRQLHSPTPGHPEYGETCGVETTTGPLGQGLATAVGMAIAQRWWATRLNDTLCNYHTYVFCGDGCLMEGISHEACSLAGTLSLGKLIVFYDNNNISIDGDTSLSFNENIPQRFQAYGWHVIDAVDGHDTTAIDQAIIDAKNDPRPTLINCRTIIARGCMGKEGSEKSHGSPFSAEEITQLRQHLQWPHPPFEIPDSVYAVWNTQERGLAWENEWQQALEVDPSIKQKLEMTATLDASWMEKLNVDQAVATRKASKMCLDIISKELPLLIGGSADLSESTQTWHQQSQAIHREDFSGNFIHYGVREFAMCAIMNGLALSGLIPYGGTFLVFSDYARNAIRLAALMKQRVIYVLTHDSICLGEDGPTHQPVEHLASLRCIPGVEVWRPCDLEETAHAWQQALNHQGPTCLILSRQSLPPCSRQTGNIGHGGYTIAKEQGPLEGILIATGAEVPLAISAQEQHLPTWRVVSMPCMERFLARPQSEQENILPSTCQRRIAIECGVAMPWHNFISRQHGTIISIDTYGVSAPGNTAYAHFGFTVENIYQQALNLQEKNGENND